MNKDYIPKNLEDDLKTSITGKESNVLNLRKQLDKIHYKHYGNKNN